MYLKFIFYTFIQNFDFKTLKNANFRHFLAPFWVIKVLQRKTNEDLKLKRLWMCKGKVKKDQRPMERNAYLGI